MSRDSIGPGTLMLAFVVGAATGAVAALLLAPASGEETREYLGQKAREGRDRARDAVDHGRDVVRKQKDTLTSAIERGREAFQQAREREEQA